MPIACPSKNSRLAPIATVAAASVQARARPRTANPATSSPTLPGSSTSSAPRMWRFSATSAGNAPASPYPMAASSTSDWATRAAATRATPPRQPRTIPAASSTAVTTMAAFNEPCHGEQTYRGLVVSHTPQWTFPRSLMLFAAQL